MNQGFNIAAVDIEREIERKIVLALRFLFSLHNRFTYDDDMRRTRVVIGIDYPENESPLKLAQLCVGGITYSFNMEASLAQNYLGAKYDDNGVKIGDNFACVIPFSYQITCYGERNASRDLANATVNNVTFVGRQIFNHLGIRTLNAEKGQTTPSSEFPKLFVTPVSCSSAVEWVGTIKAFDASKLNLLEKIKLNMDKNF